MQFWFQKSEKEKGTAYVGAEHGDVSAFAALHAGRQELAHIAGAIGMAAMLRQLAKRTREIERREEEARRRLKLTPPPRKDPCRSTGMNLNVPLHRYGRKRR